MTNNNIPIFLTSDDNYIGQTATAMASICCNTKSFIDFYILDTGITNFSKTLIEQLKDKFDNFSVEYIDIFTECKEQIKIFNNNQWQINMYAKLFAPSLKPELDRILILDSDIICCKDIKELYDEDLEGCVLGGCNIYFYNISFLTKKFPDLNLDEKRYITGGVFLIDCKKFREQKILDKVFLSIKKYGLLNDDVILYSIISNDSKILDIKYNFSQTGQKQIDDNYYNRDAEHYIKTRKDVFLRHYYGGKPWDTKFFADEFVRDFNAWWYYAKMTPFYDILQLHFIANVSKKQEQFLEKKMVDLFKMQENIIAENSKIQENISVMKENILTALNNQKRKYYPKWFIKLICCFVFKKKNRKHIRKKYIKI